MCQYIIMWLYGSSFVWRHMPFATTIEEHIKHVVGTHYQIYVYDGWLVVFFLHRFVTFVPCEYVMCVAHTVLNSNVKLQKCDFQRKTNIEYDETERLYLFWIFIWLSQNLRCKRLLTVFQLWLSYFIYILCFAVIYSTVIRSIKSRMNTFYPGLSFIGLFRFIERR